MKYLFSLLGFTLVVLASAQPADTADTGYKVGYYVGAWLPFLLMGTIALVLYLLFRKRASEE